MQVYFLWTNKTFEIISSLAPERVYIILQIYPDCTEEQGMSQVLQFNIYQVFTTRSVITLSAGNKENTTKS